ncbi:MAG TPA: hypothetical protein VE954_18645 [Oligoflexus sp.]|uniref:hypothetical protein n=1 Tax=Oligoflexus sp. TaxID=1971216 RepID=UPI002D53E8DB|nr:hypothetical protein [Oligoflexus sp.]HYX35120.1 hypothetical protein [Oligoflexus sp.]
MRKLWAPMLLLLVNACVSGGGGGKPVFTAESAQIELVRRPSGFLPGGKGPVQLQIKREDLSAQALAQLQSIRTMPLESVPCREDASWVRTLRIVDQQGASQVYYADDYACPKSEKRLIVKGESLDTLEKLLK